MERLNGSDFANRLYKGVALGLPYYWRDESIEVPHNLFTNPNALWQLATEQGVNQPPRLHGMAFLNAPPPGTGSRVATSFVTFPSTSAAQSP